MRPMLKALPVCPLRFRAKVRPITTKPARVRIFIPKRMSLVNALSPSVRRGRVLVSGNITAFAGSRHRIRLARALARTYPELRKTKRGAERCGIAAYRRSARVVVGRRCAERGRSGGRAGGGLG